MKIRVVGVRLIVFKFPKLSFITDFQLYITFFSQFLSTLSMMKEHNYLKINKFH